MAALAPPVFSRLLPDGVVTVETREPGEPGWLIGGEADSLRKPAPKRLAEFAAGRHCSRRALAHFGVGDFPVRAAADRQPIWPQAIVGSITHTEGFCAAAVAERRRYLGIGIDTEVVAAMSEELQAKICVPAEIAWVHALPDVERAAAAMLVFSAKEAFFKCQYPLVGEWLDFKDVRIEPEWQPGAEAAAVVMWPTRPIALDRFAPQPLTGRYRFHERYVSVGVTLPARPAAQ